MTSRTVTYSATVSDSLSYIEDVGTITHEMSE